MLALAIATGMMLLDSGKRRNPYAASASGSDYDSPPTASGGYYDSPSKSKAGPYNDPKAGRAPDAPAPNKVKRMVRLEDVDEAARAAEAAEAAKADAEAVAKQAAEAERLKEKAEARAKELILSFQKDGVPKHDAEIALWEKLKDAKERGDDSEVYALELATDDINAKRLEILKKDLKRKAPEPKPEELQAVMEDWKKRDIGWRVQYSKSPIYHEGEIYYPSREGEIYYPSRKPSTETDGTRPPPPTTP